ncbi:hypothetical protein [Paenirhodobacter sp.]
MIPAGVHDPVFVQPGPGSFPASRRSRNTLALRKILAQFLPFRP